MRSIFVSPHYYSASILAKLAVVCSTAVWAFVVLVNDDALSLTRFPLYARMTALVDAKVWAAVALICSVLAFYRIWVHATPRWYGSILYGWFMCFWLYIALGVVTTPGLLLPAMSGAVGTIAGLAVYAFIVNPKQ